MTENTDHQSQPDSEMTSSAQTLLLPEVLTLLAKILFLLSFGLVNFVMLINGASLIDSLLLGLGYGVVAFIAGSMPMAAGASLYIRSYERGHASIGVALVWALAASALLAFFIGIIFLNLDTFLMALTICYLHAAPTAVIAHLILKRRRPSTPNPSFERTPAKAGAAQLQR